jgi:capsular polysaccharide biosynthesis protein
MIEGASIIISPHGAGLANIIFASKGSNIIELFGAHYTDQYQLLALELEQKYIKIACISEDGLYRNEYSRSSHSIADLNRKSFSVDVNEIAKIVETIDSSFNV